jgi:hypothetical protein
MSSATKHSLLTWIDQYPREIPDGVEIYLLKDQGIDNKYANFESRKSFFQSGFCIKLGKDFLKDEYSKDFDFWKLVWESIFDPFAASKYIKRWFITFLLNRFHYPFPNPDFDYVKLLEDKEEDGAILFFFLPNYFGTKNYGYDPTIITKAFNKGKYEEIFKDVDETQDGITSSTKLLVDDLLQIDQSLEPYADQRVYVMHEFLQSWHNSTMNMIYNRLIQKKVPFLNGTGTANWLSSDNNGVYFSSDAKYQQKTPTNYTGTFYLFIKSKGAPIPPDAPTPITYLGHVGWGFSKMEGDKEVFVGGSVEQFSGSMWSKSFQQMMANPLTGGNWSEEYNPIGIWHHTYDSAQQMISDFKKASRADIVAKFKTAYNSNTFNPETTLKGEKDTRIVAYHEIMGDYDIVLSIAVQDANPSLAQFVADIARKYFYYGAYNSNCLDNTIMMMNIYGIDPSLIVAPELFFMPNNWYKRIIEEHGNSYEQVL